MEYPKNGSVIIIDDIYSEVADLISVLNQNKVPTLYFNGDLSGLPENGFDNLRLLFLDMNLDGDSFQSGQEEQVISKLMIILKKLISSNNGQYGIIVWSTMANTFFPLLNEKIEEDRDKKTSFLNKHPSFLVEVDKSNVSNTALIQSKIEETLNNNQSFLKYYIVFENMMLESTKEVLNDLDSISTDNPNILKTLSFFTDSKSLDNEDKNSTKLLSKAFGNISHMLYEKMNKKTTNTIRYNDFSQEDIVSYAEALEKAPEINDIAMMNTFYHIDNIQTKEFYSGNVYLYDDFLKISCSNNSCSIKWAENLHIKIFNKELKSRIEFKQKPFQDLYNETDKKISKEIFISNEIQKVINNDIINIFIEISPICDATQQKWKKLRLIFGVLIPYEYKINAIGDSFNTCNNMIIEYNSKNYSIALDLQTVSAINHDAFNTLDTIFRFKQEFIVDLQQKVANHFSRPGFFNMNDYIPKSSH